MEQKERMERGLIYNPNASEIAEEQSIYMEMLWEFNQLRPSEQEQKQKYMKQTLLNVETIVILNCHFMQTGAERICILEIRYMPILISLWWMMVRSLSVTR